MRSIVLLHCTRAKHTDARRKRSRSTRPRAAPGSFQSFRNLRARFARGGGDFYNPPPPIRRSSTTMNATLAALTECIAPQMAAVERLFHEELTSDLAPVNTLIKHVSRFRGKMLR